MNNKPNNMERKLLCEIGVGRKSWWEGQGYYEEAKTIVRTCQNELFGLEIDNKEFLPPINSSIECFYKSDNEKEVWLLVEQNNKYGLIKCTEHACTFDLEIKYDEISYGKIKCNGLYGIYNIHKGWIIPCLYEEIIKETEQGYVVKQNGLKGIHNLIPCAYDNIILEKSCTIVVKNNRIGVYKSGKEIIHPAYDKIECLFDYDENFIFNNIIYKTHLNDKVGVYKNEHKICNPIYDDFTIDKRSHLIKLKGLYGIITDNNKIIEPQFQSIKRLYPNFYSFFQSGKWGVVDENSNVIFKPQFQDVDSIDIVNDKDKPLFKVKIEEYWGVIDWEEKFIVPAIYDYISTDEGIIYTRKGRNKYKIDKDEEFVGKIGYDQSCGYINNPTIFAYDKNLNDLLAAPTE